uniref:Uncharacterized protein n=1 Tax=Hucho hucho TaxID=62062 RepID=A0A4W5P6X9_9TELE
MPRSRLGHVITPLGLVEVHLLLCIGEHGQVGQGPLLAEVGGHRQPPLRATCTVHPQFPSLGTLGHPRLAPLGCHANSFALDLAVRFGTFCPKNSIPLCPLVLVKRKQKRATKTQFLDLWSFLQTDYNYFPLLLPPLCPPDRRSLLFSPLFPCPLSLVLPGSVFYSSLQQSLLPLKRAAAE